MWFQKLRLVGREILPIFQGGMGVGISAHRLAGAVAKEGAMGTIASIDLRHHHPDLLEQSEGKDRDLMDWANHVALDREIKMAKEESQGNGLIAVNVMKAVRDHVALVKQACESGADVVVMGAGLPLELPDLVQDHPNVGLIPILSESRGIGIVLKRWMRKSRLPSAIIIENPAHAGGHLGAPQLQDIGDERFDFAKVIEGAQKIFEELGLGKDAPPLIVAGGIDSHEKVRHWLTEGGAQGVQLGTAFAVTAEGDAHPNFKEVLLNADPTDMEEFTSVAGLPARAVKTRWLKSYKLHEPKLQQTAKADPRRCVQAADCLTHCGLRDGISKWGQFCIDLKLISALKGEVDKGLFFRGAGNLPFGNTVRSVHELIEYLLSGIKPASLA